MSYNRVLVHGTLSGYLYRGCRCEECLQANRDYYGRRSLADYRAETEPKHGTESCYTNRGCRCEPCRSAAAAARRDRRRTGTVSTHNYAGYANGCRCDVCREDVNRYRRAQRAALRAA